MDSDYYTNNKEAAVAGALLADELFLQGVDKNQTSMPHFKVMDYDSWAGSINFVQGFQGPGGILVDVDGDGLNDLKGSIDRYVPEAKVTSFGNS